MQKSTHFWTIDAERNMTYWEVMEGVRDVTEKQVKISMTHDLMPSKLTKNNFGGTGVLQYLTAGESLGVLSASEGVEAKVARGAALSEHVA
jgi:hypothetical protein